MIQISALVLYGYQGERKIVPFKLGKVNIITGGSKTGKSVIGDIIDYCFGDKDCTIADGVVREHVAWFGLQLVNDGSYFFVARENPPANQASTNQCRYMLGSDVIPNKIEEGTTSANSDEIVSVLSKSIGINEANFKTIGGNGKLSNITIRHAMYYCIQSQSDIDSKNFLFHHQSEPYIPQTIKETLPYFWGAVDENAAALIKEKRNLEKEKRNLEESIEERKDLVGEGYQKGAVLIGEAQNVGLLSDNAFSEKETFSGVRDALAGITIEPRKILENNVAGFERIKKLQLDYRDLIERASAIGVKIAETKEALKLFDGFSNESEHQKGRLESIGLYEKMVNNNDVCPFCKQKITSDNDPVKENILLSLDALNVELNRVSETHPELTKHLSSLEEEKNGIMKRIRDTAAEIESIKTLDEKTKSVLDYEAKQQYVLGRINYWLENVQEPSTIDLLPRLKTVNSRLEEIYSKLDEDEISAKTKYAENIINNHLTDWSKKLKLEYASFPYRFDETKLTIFVDEKRPIPLYQMGSGQNWVGCHLMVALAFQSFFIENKRPVPSFVFFDQPSKAFYPPDDAKFFQEENENVKLFYDFMFDIVDNLQGKLQLIITDHADLQTPKFQDAIVARWWGNDDANYLVPPSWSSRPEG